MNSIYDQNKTTVSMIRYHIIFCPRFRRKIFTIPNLKSRFTELASLACRDLEVEIINISYGDDYVYLHVKCLPEESPAAVVKTIKMATSYILRNEFEELHRMPNLWTRNYFASTEEKIAQDTIQWYVSLQKTRS